MPDTSFPATLRTYRVYGVEVRSELRFGSLEPAPAGEESVVVRIAEAPPAYFRQRVADPSLNSEEWIHYRLLADGAVYMKVDRLFEAVISADGSDVACRRLEAADAEAFEANLVNFVLVAALTLQGEETLHATVVDLGKHTVGLLGPSGAGKSTLAASLLAKGAELVTDDMLRMAFVDGRVLAHQGPHRLKLFEEEARRLLPQAARRGWLNPLSGKVMVEPGTRYRSRALRPLSALFWLTEPPASGVTVHPLSGADVIKALVASTMDIRYSAPDRLARQLRFAERLARSVPVYELRYPRDHSMLAAVAGRIGEALDT